MLKPITTCCFPDMLLPANKMVDFSKSGEAVKLFNTVSGLYGFAIRALESLKEGKLINFDSLATDCSCHLRALQIAAIAQEIFASKSDLGVHLEKTLQSLKEKQAILKSVGPDLTVWCKKEKKISEPLTPIVAAIQALQEESKSSSYDFTIQDVLEKLHVKSDISSELAYLIDAYFLTLVKGYQLVNEEDKKKDKVVCANKDCGEILALHHHIFKEVTLPKNLSICMKKWESSNIAANFLERESYRIAKKHLADLSVQFLLQETEKLDDPHTFSLLSQSQKLVEGKIEVADFYSLTGAFKVSLQKEIPVLLKIKKCLHAHRYQEPSIPFDVVIGLFPKGKKFEIKSFDGIANGPVIVVEGKRSGKLTEEESATDYVKRLMDDFDFLHFCELDGAQHKQYTGDEDSLDQKPSEVILPLKNEKYIFEAKRLDALKEEAEKKGCAFYNQSLLIFSHIFADMLDKQLETLGLLSKADKKAQAEKEVNKEGVE